MEERPIHILHVLGRLNRGGAESRIMDLYRRIDRSRVQFDFLVHFDVPKGEKNLESDHLYSIRPADDFDPEILSLGGKIYVLPRFTGTNLGIYKKACRKFFAAHHGFAAVEGHMTSMAAVYLPIAKEAGVPVTMAHARSAGVDAGIRGKVTRFFRRNLSEKCDLMLSCSKPATVSVFGQKAADSGKVIFVPNAIDVPFYRFDAAKRKQMRAELGISPETFAIGHVGRFDPVKNQQFLVPVLQELLKRNPSLSVCFVFAGRGDQEESVKAAFSSAGLEGSAIFCGLCDREKTAGLYQAFDAFVLPSLYEGLPGTVIEAQAAGLSCVISDTITDEVCITPLVSQLPISDPVLWAEKLVDMAGKKADRMQTSLSAAKALEEAGFDVTKEAALMQKFYLGLGKD